MKRHLLFFLSALIAISGCKKKIPSEISEAQFLNPSVENRPLAFWDWLNGYVDSTRLVYELEQMKSKGMQGAFIWDVGSLSDPEKVIPAGPEFLGKESLHTISTVLKNSARLGLNMGMITSSSWNAGGSWIGEEDASMQLLKSVQTVSGPSVLKTDIRKPEEPRKRNTVDYKKLVAAVAVPHTDNGVIDYSKAKPIKLDAFVKDGNKLEWNVPAGEWDIVSFFMCATGQPLECPSPHSKGLMIDHLSKDATRKHFDTIRSRLSSISTPVEKLKYLEVDSYEVWPAKDWSPEFISEFKKRMGYDPVPYMPLLQGYQASDKILAERFKGDYGRVVSDMIIDHHFQQGKDLTNKDGMKLFAEAGHGGYPRVDPLKAMGHVDVPMGEFWNGSQFWVTKEASSSAHIYGKTIVASESLTGWRHWQDGPSNYKQLFDVAFCEGMNQVFFHTFAHNPEIAGKPGFGYHAGEHLNVNTTWWEMSRPFMDYVSRCSYMLRIGNFVGDFCMYYGDQTPNLVPPKRIDPNIKPRHQKDECQHCGQPKPVDPGEIYGHDYDYMNAEIITTALKVQDGNLVLPSGITYRFMLLPDREDISLDVLRSLEKLVSEGAVIIGPKPSRTTSLQGYPACDQEVREIAGRLWGKCDGKNVLCNTYGKGKVYWGITVNELLDEMEIVPDFDVQGVDNRDRHIDYIHHRTSTEDIYFVTNSHTTPQKITCTFRVDRGLVPELWDAETGLVQREVEYRKSRNGITLDFVMDPFASRFVVFRPSSTGVNDPDLDYDLQFGFHKASVKPVYSQDLSTDWNISFDPRYGGPAAYKAARLSSWSESADEGVRYFSGKAVYSKEFTIDKGRLSNGRKVFLTFDDIQETARVIVNGQDCGILWTPPYQLSVGKYLKEGKNELKVEVINTWNNRLVGDMADPKGKQYTRTNVKYKFKGKGLLPSGIIGKANMIFIK